LDGQLKSYRRGRYATKLVERKVAESIDASIFRRWNITIGAVKTIVCARRSGNKIKFHKEIDELLDSLYGWKIH
jgi:hypothetical protein